MQLISEGNNIILQSNWHVLPILLAKVGVVQHNVSILKRIRVPFLMEMRRDMEENHQDNAENKLKSTENKPWLLLSEPEDEKEAQKALARLRKRLEKNEKGAFNTTRNWTGFKGKTLWDWLNLLATLLIPLMVVGVTIGFGWWQAHLADVQHQQDQASTLDQQQATILQAYIDNIQDLLLNHNLLKSSSFDPSNPYYDVAILAQARTLTALQGLNPERKGRLLLFLYEAKLIGFEGVNEEIYGPIINLDGANLNHAIISFAALNGASLKGAVLDGADLSGTDLSFANLSFAHLDGANLSKSLLIGTDLSFAHLGFARLSGAVLSGAILSETDVGSAYSLTQQQLDDVSSCAGATLPHGLTCHHKQ